MDGDFIKVIPLGGVGEIGKNITALEVNDEIIVIDCGIAFPDEEMYGVDLIIPDISYLIDNKDKVKGLFITHGHEDHIGAIPYILKQLNMDVYGTKLTLAIIENKLREHNLVETSNLILVNPGEMVSFNNLSIEFIQSTHSIAESCCFAIKTKLGTIFHTGDFKIELTPIDDKVIDIDRISTIGKEGVLLLMADSTNVERSGYTMSERSIGNTFNRIFATAKGRVIIATFASNIHRMQQIVNASLDRKRKVAFAGRSMESISRMAVDLEYLHMPEDMLIEIDDIKNYNNENITIITTGSQGEPMAALARIAYGNHKKIKIESDDLFIISAAPIPGNDKLISKVINELFKKGADVIYEDLEEVHVSGHAYREELKLMHRLIKPKYFMPVHGEYRHLKHHKDLAISLGMDPSDTFILERGDVLLINKDEAKKEGKVKTGTVLVDGLGVGDVGTLVLRDRKHLAQDGLVNIVVTIERESFSIIAGPDIITRGFVYVKEAEELIKELKDIATNELQSCLDNRIIEWYLIKTNIKKAVERYIYDKTKRRPTIIPIIMEI
ncbi:ribonuclease J [Clostridium sartagoforme]|uniref:Ribonuclease J n=1 Tax=Clostridium sartagoforme TaxID=84031 RepID=A0A4S2DP69_9CLOT|nr:ribonuclease J [Clostridium sartagoforme]TGY44207.1 ribonuclease J [Clostridium sartagoforme]